jgi:cell wall-associated protease
MSKVLSLAISSVLLAAQLYVSAQTTNTDPRKHEQWYLKDLMTDGIPGISLDSALWLVRDKQPVPVIVAVIDAGVDIEHPELCNQLWINPREVAADGIDNDRNGYVDDVYGWNFLGTESGLIVKGENLEVTRLYKQYSDRFGNRKASEIKRSEREEYQLYQRIKIDYEAQLNEAVKKIALYMGFKETLVKNLKTVNKLLKGQELNAENLAKLEPKSPKKLEAVNMIREWYIVKGFTPEKVDSWIENEKNTINVKLNVNNNQRLIVGDDLSDMSDSLYGNNNYSGETAGHGTSVAGVIASEAGNSAGIQGICRSARIMTIRVVPGGDEHDKDVALAIRYAVNHGAQVINCSFGKDYSPYKWMVDSAIRYAEAHGVLVVHAAGNDSRNIDDIDNYPSKSDLDGRYFSNMINIGASTSITGSKLVAGFSNYGRKEVDLFAPGADILSLRPDSAYEKGSGTSLAAPVVSGVAALLLSYYPDLTPQDIISILLESSYKPDPYLKVIIPGQDTEKIPFRDMSVSGGIVNAHSALKMAAKGSAGKIR